MTEQQHLAGARKRNGLIDARLDANCGKPLQELLEVQSRSFDRRIDVERRSRHAVRDHRHAADQHARRFDSAQP